MPEFLDHEVSRFPGRWAGWPWPACTHLHEGLDDFAAAFGHPVGQFGNSDAFRNRNFTNDLGLIAAAAAVTGPLLTLAFLTPAEGRDRTLARTTFFIQGLRNGQLTAAALAFPAGSACWTRGRCRLSSGSTTRAAALAVATTFDDFTGVNNHGLFQGITLALGIGGALGGLIGNSLGFGLSGAAGLFFNLTTGAGFRSGRRGGYDHNFLNRRSGDFDLLLSFLSFGNFRLSSLDLGGSFSSALAAASSAAPALRASSRAN